MYRRKHGRSARNRLLKFFKWQCIACAFELEAQRRLVAVLVEVGDVELAAGFDACAAIEVKLKDGPVANIGQRIPRGHPHQLPGVCFGEGAGFIDGVGGLARDWSTPYFRSRVYLIFCVAEPLPLLGPIVGLVFWRLQTSKLLQTGVDSNIFKGWDIAKSRVRTTLVERG